MDAQSLLLKGLASSQANDAAGAVEWFIQASKAEPSAGLPQFLLGSEYAALGDIAQAETAIANAVLLAPELTIARYQLGLLQFSSGRAAVALLTWAPLLELPSTEVWPHFVRGFAALAQDWFEEALAFFETGLAINTANPAMSSDIHKVMAGVRALPAFTEGSANLAAALTPQQSDETQDHVLLAGYRLH